MKTNDRGEERWEDTRSPYGGDEAGESWRQKICGGASRAGTGTVRETLEIKHGRIWKKQE
jgi:hypothetical protein